MRQHQPRHGHDQEHHPDQVADAEEVSDAERREVLREADDDLRAAGVADDHALDDQAGSERRDERRDVQERHDQAVGDADQQTDADRKQKADRHAVIHGQPGRVHAREVGHRGDREIEVEEDKGDRQPGGDDPVDGRGVEDVEKVVLGQEDVAPDREVGAQQDEPDHRAVAADRAADQGQIRAPAPRGRRRRLGSLLRRYRIALTGRHQPTLPLVGVGTSTGSRSAAPVPWGTCPSAERSAS